MRTFADMTPQERADCTGAWCEYTTPLGDKDIAIFESGTTLFQPVYGRFTAPLATIIPRLDLPRAWNLAGKPVRGW